MGHFLMQSGIRQKLDAFIKMHHRQRLIRGAVAVGAIGLLLFGAGFLIEHYLWLNSVRRTLLFCSMWALFLPLFSLGVVRPFLQMRGLGKVLSQRDAAQWIGRHFPEVSDKLINLLQLEDMAGVQSGNELLLASIEEKTLALKDVPFLMALDWQRHRKWVYRFGAFLLLLLAFGAYESTELLQGASRVFQYNKEFVKQAPFSLKLLREVSEVEEGQDVQLTWQAEGALIPETVEVKVGEQWRRARKLRPGVFTFVIDGVTDDLDLYVRAMDFVVNEHKIKVRKQPHWQGMEVYADFPAYTGIKDGVLSQSEAVEVVEGTRLQYRLKGDRVKQWHVGSSFRQLQKGASQQLLNSDKGAIFSVAANKNQRWVFAMQGNYGLSLDTLQSVISVREDAFPDIQVEAVADTLRLGTWYFTGLASDDYLVNEVVFYHRVAGSNGSWKKTRLFEGAVAQWGLVHAIDLVGLGVQSGEALEYQFAVKDNDGLRGGKTFRTKVMTLERMGAEKASQWLEKQEAGIGAGMSKSSKTLKELQKESQKLQESLQQNQSGWDQENKIKQWLNEQQKMVESLKQLEKKQSDINKQKNATNPPSEEMQKKKEELNKRMKQLTSPEMQKLIDEINRLMEQKASKEQLQEKMQKLNQMSQETSKELEKLMEQLKQLELEEAIENQVERMQEWAEKEEALQKTLEQEKGKEVSEAVKQQQEAQNEALKDIEQGMQDIEQKNQDLEKPMNLKSGESERKEAEDAAKKASQEMKNNRKSGATEQMKKSAQKMKEAMQKMQESFEQEQKQRMAEDYQALRALLENLIDASNRQETILMELRKMNPDNPKQVALNREQMRLKESLGFIEDSLMALAKRQTMINQFVTREMSRVNAQMAMSLEKMKVRNPRAAAQHQQFVMTGLNNLADMLMESLQNMQQQMNSEQKKEGDKSCDNPNKSGQGKQGKPKPGSKLSESQKALGEQLQKMQQRKQGKPGQDGKPQGGSPQSPGENGEPSQRELNEELAKMALMQEALRRQVEQLRKELGQEGKQGMSNALQEVEKLMEQNEKDLVNGKVTPQSLERQKQIMTRLLEHEKAERKQEQEDRREANQAPNFVPTVPPELAEEARKKASEREALRRIQPVFKPYYKQSVQKYLQIYSR
jgi:hypothetical protein